MKKLTTLAPLVLTGCTTTPRAWLMADSPYWDMLYEGSPFHLTGIAIAGFVWWWWREDWAFQGGRKSLLIAVVIVSLFIGIGLYRGYKYIHTPCTWSQESQRDCPAYKNKLWRINDQWDSR